MLTSKARIPKVLLVDNESRQINYDFNIRGGRDAALYTSSRNKAVETPQSSSKLTLWQDDPDKNEIMDGKLNILERASNPSSVRIMEGDVLDDGENEYNNP